MRPRGTIESDECAPGLRREPVYAFLPVVGKDRTVALAPEPLLHAGARGSQGQELSFPRLEGEIRAGEARRDGAGTTQAGIPDRDPQIDRRTRRVGIAKREPLMERDRAESPALRGQRRRRRGFRVSGSKRAERRRRQRQKRPAGWFWHRRDPTDRREEERPGAEPCSRPAARRRSGRRSRRRAFGSRESGIDREQADDTEQEHGHREERVQRRIAGRRRCERGDEQTNQVQRERNQRRDQQQSPRPPALPVAEGDADQRDDRESLGGTQARARLDHGERLGGVDPQHFARTLDRHAQQCERPSQAAGHSLLEHVEQRVAQGARQEEREEHRRECPLQSAKVSRSAQPQPPAEARAPQRQRQQVGRRDHSRPCEESEAHHEPSHGARAGIVRGAARRFPPDSRDQSERDEDQECRGNGARVEDPMLGAAREPRPARSHQQGAIGEDPGGAGDEQQDGAGRARRRRQAAPGTRARPNPQATGVHAVMLRESALRQQRSRASTAIRARKSPVWRLRAAGSRPDCENLPRRGAPWV